ALGLGRDDPYVRNRLALKLEIVLDDLSAEPEPSDEELARFLEEHPERFAEPERLSFRQVYLNPDRHPSPAAEAERRLELLRRGADPDGLGDVSMLAPGLEAASRDEVARELGGDFADVLAGVEPGVWSGPVRSPFGLHLVLVTAREPGRQPALAEVREAVRAEWREQRRREAREQAYRRLRERYEVVVEAGTPAGQKDAAVAAAPASEAERGSP
ncbi:MAG: peptidylprolyl isomerase, partial [Chromatiales bacterium]